MIRINFRGLSSIVEHVEERVALSLCATNEEFPLVLSYIVWEESSICSGNLSKTNNLLKVILHHRIS